MKHANRKNIATVLRRMADQCTDKVYAQEYAVRVDYLLDSLREEDFFGTEGQCDPRGDQRD